MHQLLAAAHNGLGEFTCEEVENEILALLS